MNHCGVIITDSVVMLLLMVTADSDEWCWCSWFLCSDNDATPLADYYDTNASDGVIRWWWCDAKNCVFCYCCCCFGCSMLTHSSLKYSLVLVILALLLLHYGCQSEARCYLPGLMLISSGFHMDWLARSPQEGCPWGGLLWSYWPDVRTGI